MEKIRFFNDMRMFAQPKEKAPKGLLWVDDDNEPTFYRDFSLAPYEYNDEKANERIEAFSKGDHYLVNISDPDTLYFGIPIGWDKLEVESKEKNNEYVNKVTKCLYSVHNQFSHVKQAFLPVKDIPQFYTAYELASEDGANIACVISFGNMFSWIESWVLPGAKRERQQFFSRNAPLFKKLFDNFHEGVDFTETQFLVVSTSGSFLNIPIKHNGVLLTVEPESKHFYEDIFSFVDTVLSQYSNVEYLDLLHSESVFLNSKGDVTALFFTRDKMKHYITDVTDIKDESVKDDLLFKGQSNRQYQLWNPKDEYAEYGEIQEIMQLINTDWDVESSSVAKAFYKYQWGTGYDEITVNFGDVDIKSLFGKFDEYELGYRMPTLYKAYINGLMGKFTEGALIKTARTTYFRFMYLRKTTPNGEEVVAKVDNACMKILRELAKFVDYIKKKEAKDSDKKAESNTDSIFRYILLSGLNSIL